MSLGGSPTLGESMKSFKGLVGIAFLREHILQLARAIRDGADVRGYFHWTLLDNYEWAHGPEAHFGLAAVDLESGERLPRRSSAVYADICAANRIDDV